MNGFDLGPQALEADRRRLLSLLTEKSYAKKKVVLSSGRESDFYIDCKKTVLTAEGHWLVGRLMFAQIAKETASAVGVGGLTMGADPLASSVALVSHLANKPLQAFLVRKEPKGHGTGQWIEGKTSLADGAEVAIVEDV
ncbi:MAG: orotate phosphoribosyltransferase, partial [Archangiaceae bacterium]|nr:orotate phosphoribosyltransferase [Archangiaceae bacterium]